MFIAVGMFSFGFIEELTGSMKSSIAFLIVFFVLWLLWLYSAMRKQAREVPAAANATTAAEV